MEPIRPVDIRNEGVEAQNGVVEGRPVVEDSHHFDEEQDPDLRIRTLEKSQIWMDTDTHYIEKSELVPY
jgi:hypothetical protein